MLEELKMVHEKFMAIIKETDGVLAAWYFGSHKHGKSDEYSDIDVVLLADEAEYHAIDGKLTEILKRACDEVILCWGEDFNGEAMKNYDYILSLNDQVFQYDVFLLNDGKLDDFMCKMHYADLCREDIIFAKGDTADMLLQSSPKGTVWHSDMQRVMDTYWLHVQMSVKYFKRRDFFKLNGVLSTLMDMHTSLLLNAYDEITWGGTANKLHYIPEEKQRHLMKYGCIEDFDLMKENLLRSINWFEEDASQIAERNAPMDYDKKPGTRIKEYWIKHMMG